MQITGYKKKHEYTNKNGITSTVYLMDCMEGMAQFPDKYFDLACVDPPYGININNQSQGKGGGVANKINYTKKDWDKNAPEINYFEKLKHISKNQIVWGANHFTSKMPFDSSCWIVWDKDNSGNFADCELAWTSFDTAVRKFQWRWNGMLQENMKNKENRIHPTQKPVALYDWLFHNYAEPNQKIIDTHLGSGSSRIAADKADLHFTGFEIDEEYFDASVKRFENYASQLTLF